MRRRCCCCVFLQKNNSSMSRSRSTIPCCSVLHSSSIHAVLGKANCDVVHFIILASPPFLDSSIVDKMTLLLWCVALIMHLLWTFVQSSRLNLKDIHHTLKMSEYGCFEQIVDNKEESLSRRSVEGLACSCPFNLWAWRWHGPEPKGHMQLCRSSLASHRGSCHFGLGFCVVFWWKCWRTTSSQEWQSLLIVKPATLRWQLLPSIQHWPIVGGLLMASS